MDEILKDDRFKHIVKDYRFKVMPKNERKFKVDKRFKNMFQDKKFKLKYTVDKRGRPTNLTTNDNLKKYYQISSSEQEDDDENDDDAGVKKSKKKKKVPEKEQDESVKKDEDKDLKADEEKTKSDEETSEEEDESDDTDKEKDDEDDDDDDDDDDDEDEETKSNDQEIPWNELDRDTERNDSISARLAICNMDWDRLKAVDLFVLLNSFKPPQGVIKSVKIYLSDYGKERIEYERVHGPQELTAAKEGDERGEGEEDEDEFGDDEEGKNFDRGKLRVYQFNRLRYYYAIVECDSSETADKIYTECDGMEYESSCNRLDLRFVPDETTFEEADVRESCLEAPDPITYKPNLFFTSALNQTKVECTWDETPRDRLAMTMRKYTEEDIKNSDFRHILATSSEEEEEGEDDEDEEKNGQKEKNENTEEQNSNEVKDPEEERIRKYRELLMLSDKKSAKKRDADLEFSWDGPLGSNQNDNDHDDEEGFNDLFNAKKKKNNKRSWKDSDKKKELTEEEKKQHTQLSLLTMDEEESKAHFNLDDLLTDKKPKRNKKKRSNDDDDEKKQADDFKINMQDPRFQAIFNNHEFNIDPSDQSFKKTKAMETLLDEKIKRIEKTGLPSSKSASSSSSSQQQPNDAHVSLLVKSIKSKTEVLNRKKEDAQKNFKTKKF